MCELGIPTAGTVKNMGSPEVMVGNCACCCQDSSHQISHILQQWGNEKEETRLRMAMVQ